MVVEWSQASQSQPGSIHNCLDYGSLWWLLFFFLSSEEILWIAIAHTQHNSLSLCLPSSFPFGQVWVYHRRWGKGNQASQTGKLSGATAAVYTRTGLMNGHFHCLWHACQTTSAQMKWNRQILEWEKVNSIMQTNDANRYLLSHQNQFGKGISQSGIAGIFRFNSIFLFVGNEHKSERPNCWFVTTTTFECTQFVSLLTECLVPAFANISIQGNITQATNKIIFNQNKAFSRVFSLWQNGKRFLFIACPRWTG